MGDTGFRSGFVALVGRPNVGKSTLLNACLGKKIAPISPVAQTTRKRLRAVINTDGAQIIIIDTPGLHKPKDALGKELNQQALAELKDADVVCCLIDATQDVGSGDAWVCKHIAKSPAYKLLVITKADIADQDTVNRQIERAQELCAFDDCIVLSAQENFNVEGFLSSVSEHLPEGPKWFPPDMSYDASTEEIIAELIREKLCLCLEQELPHSVGVICEELSISSKQHASISALILVERESQKAIVVGAKGSMIKRVGTLARQEIERLLNCTVYLKLNVKVQPAWRKDAHEIKRLGYAFED